MTERKPIDPALQRFLDEQAKASSDLQPETDKERAHTVRLMMMRTLESRTHINGLPNGVEAHNVTFGAGLSARIYAPPQLPLSIREPLPVLVYLHGGGWVAGSVATLEPFCRLLSEAAGVIICSVEYRLAPEDRYPAAVHDALAAVEWAANHAGEWGGNAGLLAVGGDSAGANLAAVAANKLCANKEAPRLSALLLLYPVADHPSANHPSYTENANGYGLDASSMRWFWNQYAPGVSPHDPDASPLQIRDIPALPPTLVATAEYDILRDEGLAYAEKLERAGVAVTRLHSPDMHHNFPVSPGTVGRFPQCEEALAEIASWLRATLGRNAPPV